MKYISTRDKNKSVTSAQAIAMGISEDSGLFVPQSFPKFDFDSIKKLSEVSYNTLAYDIFSKFLTDFSEQEIKDCIKKAYTAEKFGDIEPVKVKKLNEKLYVLELFHGPTCAFKDMALQILPHFLSVAMSHQNGINKSVILTATSGDTGKAALEGFKNVKNTHIIVFYPEDGVSDMQKLQMQTQDGNNVYVCSVEGNFDDVQSSVKKIFTDKKCIKILGNNGFKFSSANSINWGRLLPQIVYYFKSYCELLKNKVVDENNKYINVCVPTGNFGNILAAYYAKKMGLPIKKFICASNANNVLTDFIETGIYNKNRDFYRTNSPSMDILISSNLERLLFDLSEENCNEIINYMSELVTHGGYTVSDDIKQKISELFIAGFCDDNDTLKTIKNIWNENKYLCDTHTAVALNVYNNLTKCDKSVLQIPTIVASTASPYKFPRPIYTALKADKDLSKCSDFELSDLLSELTNTTIPEPISALKNKTIVFDEVCKANDMENKIFKYLKIND